MEKKIVIIQRLTVAFLVWWGAQAIAAPTNMPRAIVNQGVAQRAISQDTLRSFFAMRVRQWPDGSVARVYVLPDDHPTHIAFCKEVLGVFPYQLRQAWDRLVFSGTGQAPKEVAGEAAMRSAIAAHPGSIGYLRQGEGGDGIQWLELQN